jgi:RHS repeat-associated protein
MHESDDGFTIAFGFTGVYFDTATSLNYHRNRWYDPAIGKWITEDPISFAAGDTNLFRYVSNSPTNLTDPSGLASWFNIFVDFGDEAGVPAGRRGGTPSNTHEFQLSTGLRVNVNLDAMEPQVQKIRSGAQGAMNKLKIASDLLKLDCALDEYYEPYKKGALHHRILADKAKRKIYADLIDKILNNRGTLRFSVRPVQYGLLDRYHMVGDDGDAYTPYYATQIYIRPNYFKATPNEQSVVLAHEYGRYFHSMRDDNGGGGLDDINLWDNIIRSLNDSASAIKEVQCK